MEYQKLFIEVEKKFPDVKANLVSFSKDSVMRSGVYSRKIYYNPNLIKKMGFSKKAIIGILAHELAHKVDKKRWSLWRLLSFKFRYKPYSEFKRQNERAADTITVQRGYGKEFLQTLRETKEKFDEERYRKFKAAHLTMKEVSDMIKKK